MTPTDLLPLANHLWQSTPCAAAAWLLTVALKNNRAAVRYWLWLTTSVKFLVPFSLLVSVGTQLGWRSAPAIIQPPFTIVVSEISRPFAIASGVSSVTPAPRTASELPIILLGVWACGVILGLAFWVRLLRQIRAIERAATPLHLNLPIRAISTSARLEPGVFGIRSPVLILPEGITERLTPVELEAVLAHEFCHVRRRDNLTAAIHMVVEILFWFHPLVWWIRTRMVEERERACDEEVLQQGGDPEVYAEGILKVCKFYLNSPVQCVSGVTGADLKKRIEQIVANRIGRGLGIGRTMGLATAGFIAVAGPVVVGMLNTPPGHAQSQTPAPAPGPAPGRVFEVASIKPSAAGNGGMRMQWPPGGRFTASNVTVKSLIMSAYHVRAFQIEGEPAWINSERYDVAARAEDTAQNLTVDQRARMLQALLADRFKLQLRHETRTLPIYVMVVTKRGPKLQQSSDSGGPSMTVVTGVIIGRKASMTMLASNLSLNVDHIVLDRTGLAGVYDFKLEWDAEETPSSGRDPLDSTTPADVTKPSLLAAMQEQLGLKLEATKGPVEVLVVKRVEKPSPN